MNRDIVKYREEHHDRLVVIWYRAVRDSHTFLSTEDFEFYHHLVKSGILREVELWVELNEKHVPTGFLGLNERKIEMLFVDPPSQGQGVGGRLLRHAEALKGSRLQVDVNEQNEMAYAFYRKYGFVQVGRSELDDSGKPYPLLHLELLG